MDRVIMVEERASELAKSRPSASGRNAVAAIIVLAALATAWNLGYQRSRVRRAMDLWGNDHAELILNAPRAELMRLAPLDAAAEAVARETVEFRGQRLRMIERRDVHNAPGFIHVRASLVEDRTFNWSDRSRADDATWEYAIRFIEEPRRATVLISPASRRVALAETGVAASIGPSVEALTKFFREQFPCPNEPRDNRRRRPNKRNGLTS